MVGLAESAERAPKHWHNRKNQGPFSDPRSLRLRKRQHHRPAWQPRSAFDRSTRSGFHQMHILLFGQGHRGVPQDLRQNEDVLPPAWRYRVAKVCRRCAGSDAGSWPALRPAGESPGSSAGRRSTGAPWRGVLVINGLLHLGIERHRSRLVGICRRGLDMQEPGLTIKMRRQHRTGFCQPQPGAQHEHQPALELGNSTSTRLICSARLRVGCSAPQTAPGRCSRKGFAFQQPILKSPLEHRLERLLPG